MTLNLILGMMGPLQLIIVILLIVLVVYLKKPDALKNLFPNQELINRFFSPGGGLKERFEALSTDLNTYIENLGFKVTGSYITIVWMAKNFVDENKFSPATKDVIAHSANLSEKYRAKEPMVRQSGNRAFWFPQAASPLAASGENSVEKVMRT